MDGTSFSPLFLRLLPPNPIFSFSLGGMLMQQEKKLLSTPPPPSNAESELACLLSSSFSSYLKSLVGREERAFDIGNPHSLSISPHIFLPSFPLCAPLSFLDFLLILHLCKRAIALFPPFSSIFHQTWIWALKIICQKKWSVVSRHGREA